MKSFLLALQFLSIIPVTYQFNATDKQLGYSVLFYPIIGILIGILLTLTCFFLSSISVQIQASLVLILWVFITGGLHLDGLADCADAWVGGLGNKQRSLAIMKDPAAGPMAVLALVLLLILKWSTITVILENNALEALFLVPMLGRLAILILMISTNYIRTGGLGERLVNNLPKTSIQGTCIFGLILGIYYLGIVPIIFMLCTLLFIAYLANRRLGGVTGDVYGAAVELVEMGLLLGILI